MPLSSPFHRTALATLLSVAAALVIVTQQSGASAAAPATQAETLPVHAAAQLLGPESFGSASRTDRGGKSRKHVIAARDFWGDSSSQGANRPF